ncbi:MAG: dTMP kinase, partial [Rhodospirillaceae bacterium]|nr:dTMP kinase [Rhodospirillaceae bacterium]
GKSTQARRLAAACRQAGIDTVLTREPGGAPGAEQIRRLLVEGEEARWDPVAETLLHFAARRDHVQKTVRPALAGGRWVVSDRFADSTVAYQGYGEGVALDRIRGLYEWAVGDLLPDLTLVLDVPVEVGLRRAAARAAGAERADRYERMDLAFHERLRQGFLAIAAAAPERCVVIDAGAPLDAVTGRVLTAVSSRFGVRLGG